MGSQIEFYMMPDDEAAFVEYAQSLCWLKLLRPFFKDPADRAIDNLQQNSDTDIYLTCATFEKNVLTRFTMETSLHHVDLLDSEIVHFTRSKLDADGSLREGRLWFDRNATGGPKTDEFNAWADKLIRYVRTRYKKDDDRRYIGPTAFERTQSGAIRLGYSAVALTKDEALRRLGLKP